MQVCDGRLDPTSYHQMLAASLMENCPSIFLPGALIVPAPEPRRSQPEGTASYLGLATQWNQASG